MVAGDTSPSWPGATAPASAGPTGGAACGGSAPPWHGATAPASLDSTGGFACGDLSPAVSVAGWVAPLRAPAGCAASVAAAALGRGMSPCSERLLVLDPERSLSRGVDETAFKEHTGVEMTN